MGIHLSIDPSVIWKLVDKGVPSVVGKRECNIGAACARLLDGCLDYRKNMPPCTHPTLDPKDSDGVLLLAGGNIVVDIWLDRGLGYFSRSI